MYIALFNHFIPPGVAGFDESGGAGGPGYDFYASPTGNLALAESYMKKAGYPSGKYTGSAVIKVVGSTGDPAPQEAAIANQAALALGFKTNFNTVDQPVMYGKYCGVPKAEIDVCPNVGWIRDWADPQTLLDPTFAGYNIVTTNNSNWSQANWQDGPYGPHPGKATTPIDIAMKAAEGTVGDSARAAAWAKVDQMLVADAVAAPWNFVKQPQIESKDVNGVLDLWNVGSFDYAWTWLK